MRVRVRQGTRPPKIGPRGGAGDSGAAAEPQYRWTFKTWIARTWKRDHSRVGDIIQERTVTVLAPNEAAAKAKIAAALPTPPRLRDSWSYQDEQHEREWAIKGDIEEVA